MGDFNIDIKADKNPPLVKKYNSMLKSCGLCQIIDEPTRITDNKSSLLDHINVTCLNKIINFGVIQTGYSDHCLVFCTRKTSREYLNRHHFVNLRSFKHYSVHALNQLLEQQSWNDVYAHNDVNIAWRNFESIFRSIIDKIAPKKHCRIKARTQPWITPEILECIHQRDKCLNKYHKLKDPHTLTQFRILRNKAQQLIKEAKNEFISNELEINKSNGKKLWNSLKLLGYQSKPRTKEHTVLKINDEICYDPVSVAQHINDFFVNVAQRLTASLPPMPDLYSTFSTNCKTFYNKFHVKTGAYKIQEVDQRFVNKELKNLVPSKGVGLDEISPRFLKDGADSLTNVIMHLINLSIRTNSPGAKSQKGLKKSSCSTP